MPIRPALRPLLAALAALAAAAPAWAASIMHGFADMSSMTLWVQTERAARVVVELHPEADPGARRRVEGATRAEDSPCASPDSIPARGTAMR
jgi:hypothetical protein